MGSYGLISDCAGFIFVWYPQALNQGLEAPLPDFPIEHAAGDETRQGEGRTQVLHYSRSFGSLPWLAVIVVMLKPLIATSLDELSRKTFWIHPQRMVLALG